ncbi:hypothetical protein Tco_1378433 [Tanacetum coccineum]
MDLSAISIVILIGFKLPSPNLSNKEYAITLILVPRSAKALLIEWFSMAQGRMKLPGFVRILIKRTKTKAKQTKPSTGMKRARKTKAEGVYILNGLTRIGQDLKAWNEAYEMLLRFWILLPSSIKGGSITQCKMGSVGVCMHTRSSSNLIVESSTTPKRRNRRRSKQRVKPFSLEETSVVTMADQRTMAELLQAPTEGYKDAIVIPAILAENFELKDGLLNLVTSKQFYGFEKEDPHAHIC